MKWWKIEEIGADPERELRDDLELKEEEQRQLTVIGRGALSSTVQLWQRYSDEGTGTGCTGIGTV
jgi:hypothetical protein